MELLVPLCFRSSCQSVLRRITNFGSGALARTRPSRDHRWLLPVLRGNKSFGARITSIGAAGKHAMAVMQPMRSVTRAAFAIAFGAAAMCVAVSEPARAQAGFDGSWSVLVITESGECDRAYRYGIHIKGGKIFYDGEAGISFTGQVESNGQLAAVVQRGEQGAIGSGRLSGSTGAGTWKGKSNTGACGGRWEAERR